MIIGKEYITRGLPVKGLRPCPVAVYVAEQSPYGTAGQCHAIDFDSASCSMVADHYRTVDDLAKARGLPCHWQGACRVIDIELPA
jgi:hypothetical protein